MIASAAFGISKQTLGWLAATSLVTLVASILILPFVVLRLPANHFLRETPPPAASRAQALRRMAGNACGALLVLTGLAMLALPGQGLLTILVGLSWMTFPRKVALERWIVTRAHLLRPMNWIRKEGHRPPLLAPTAATKGVDSQAGQEPLHPQPESRPARRQSTAGRDHPMQSEQLRESLRQLRATIEASDLSQGPAREKLNQLISDIEHKLEDPDDAERHASLVENVKDSIQHLELEHPRATTILNQIMAALGGVGI
ncbi:MAG: hypothetical protein ACI8QZ_000253 [Chlamydiales bacterium]